MMLEPDPAAFCERVRGRLVGSLALYCGDRSLAEELAQEALARAWERWAKVSTMAAPEAWTFRTGMNLANSWYRRRRAERTAYRRLAGPEAYVDDDHAQVETVRQAVLALPDRQRAAVIARFYLDLDVAQTAELLDCAPGTVKAATHSAIAKLRSAGLLESAAEESEANT